MNDYTVEMLVTVEARSWDAALREGERLARVLRGSHVAGVVIADVREDEAAEETAGAS